MSIAANFLFPNFDSPLMGDVVQPDDRMISPPPDKIIMNSILHPRTMGLSDSTKKLCYAPNIKTAVCKSKTKQVGTDSASGEAIYFRYLSFLAEYDKTDESVATGDTVPVVVDEMINSIIRLNQMFILSPKLTKEDGGFVLDGSRPGDIEKLNYYNSFSSLVMFGKNYEIYKSASSVGYRAQQRFDRRWYFLKMALGNKTVVEIKSLNRFLSSPLSFYLLLCRSNMKLFTEMKILSITDHPNIVKYFTSWFEQRNFVIQLEYVAGESLYYFLYSTMKSQRSEFKMLPLTNRASELAALMLVKQIIGALGYLHETVGVVHNSVEPSHIMISHAGFSRMLRTDEIQSVRSVIFQCLLATRVPKDVQFKLSGFGHSFRLDGEYVAYESDYLPLVDKSSVKTSDYWSKRDMHALGMTVVHAMRGANRFCRADILQSPSKCLDMTNATLRDFLDVLIDGPSAVDLKDLLLQ